MMIAIFKSRFGSFLLFHAHAKHKQKLQPRHRLPDKARLHKASERTSQARHMAVFKRSSTSTEPARPLSTALWRL